MIRLSVLLCPALLAVAHGSDALAQNCNGESLGTFQDTCRASYIELETSDKGRRRVYAGEEICFIPREEMEWIWYCRGYEEGARCRAKHEGNVDVRATMEKGEVRWECYER